MYNINVHACTFINTVNQLFFSHGRTFQGIHDKLVNVIIKISQWINPSLFMIILLDYLWIVNLVVKISCCINQIVTGKSQFKVLSNKCWFTVRLMPNQYQFADLWVYCKFSLAMIFGLVIEPSVGA